MPSLEGWHSMRGTGTLWGGHRAGAPNQNDRPIEWDAIKDNIDLAAIATALLGRAPGRRGERGRRLWWPCPFHDDSNPSFCVTAARREWKCFGCGEHGSAADLVMRLQNWTFPEAVRWLADQARIVMPSGQGEPTRPRPPAAKPGKTPAPAPEKPSGLPLADALKLVEDAAGRLWTPEGDAALAYLMGRGLTEDTIRRHRLGWTPGVGIPIEGGVRYWGIAGVVIPWLDGDRLAMVKVRRLGEFKGAKYVEAYRDRPAIYPTPAAIQPGKPLVVCEGEFDAMLLGQALGDLTAVVTLGSASSRPDPLARRVMRSAPVWYLAHDADGAGDRSAEGWPARSIRVRPPSPHKDWGELHAAGFNLIRYFWHRILAAPTPWEELARERWGDAVGDPEPGIVVCQSSVLEASPLSTEA